mgnify:CR=1 FL=1
MKRCLACDARYQAPVQPADEYCPNCNSVVTIDQGVQVFAPDSTQSSEGFKAEYFDDLVRVEEHNFWFRARNKLIAWAFGKYAHPVDDVLEIGCGNGYVLSGLQKAFPKARLSGSEIFLNGLHFAAQRLPNVTLMQMDARDIPFANHFDVIGAFDVLEHIQEDEKVLEQVHNALKPSGRIILSVPQHMWLWSVTDDYACHVRRYTAHELKTKLETAGFDIERSTSFVFFLLPAMLASRLSKRNVSAEDLDTSAELQLNSVMNTLLYWIMLSEAFLIKLGFSFPVGGSRLIVARKR